MSKTPKSAAPLIAWPSGARPSNEFFEEGPNGPSDAGLHALLLGDEEADAADRKETRQRPLAEGVARETVDHPHGPEEPPRGGVAAAVGGSPPPVRYIKLGPGGQWAKRSIETGEIHFGHRSVPHEIALERNRDRIVAFNVERGKSPGKAADLARELHDFYTLGSDAIWIPVYDGFLWWAHADTEVTACEPGVEQGARFRRTIGGWRSTDRKGQPLLLDALSTRLTKVAAYLQTLCKVEAADYLLRKLDGEDEPAVLRARELRGALLASAEELIAGLHCR